MDRALQFQTVTSGAIIVGNRGPRDHVMGQFTNTTGQASDLFDLNSKVNEPTRPLASTNVHGHRAARKVC